MRSCGNQSGLHAAQRSKIDQLLSQSESRDGKAEDASGFSRGPETGDDDAYVAEPDRHGRRAGNGMGQVERGNRPGPRRDLAVHAHGRGADGLHAGGDAERTEKRFSGDRASPDEPGHALPSTGNVRRVRGAAADAFGQSIELFARAGDYGISRARSFGVG